MTWAYPIFPQFVNRNVSLGPNVHHARYSCGQRRCSTLCVSENQTAYSWLCFVFMQSCHGYWWSVFFFKTQRVCRNIKRFLKTKPLNSCGAGGGGKAGNTPVPSSFFTFRFSSNTAGVAELQHPSKLGGVLSEGPSACVFLLA